MIESLCFSPPASAGYASPNAAPGQLEESQVQHQDIDRSASESSSIKLAIAEKHNISKGTRRAVRQASVDNSRYDGFRRHCDEILEELGKIDRFMPDGETVSDEGAEVVVEIEACLEVLYDYVFGKGESLKRVVVAIQGQVNNVQWDKRHVAFICEIVKFLRVRSLIDEATVKACLDMIKAHGLDPFRGTICEPTVVRRYRIEEVS